jgi:hypothetical protein
MITYCILLKKIRHQLFDIAARCWGRGGRWRYMTGGALRRWQRTALS